MASADKRQRLLEQIRDQKTRMGHFNISDVSRLLSKLCYFSEDELTVLQSSVKEIVDPSSGELDPDAFVAWLFDDGGLGEKEAALAAGARKTEDDGQARGEARPSEEPSSKQDEYRTAASIVSALRSRSAILIDGTYFMDAQAAGRRLEPRQVIERDHPQFVIGDLEDDKLFAMRVDALGKCWLYDAPEGGIIVVAVSYGWLAPTHPDPEGHHLMMLAGLVRHFLSVLSRYKLRVAVFLDYCSLYQSPKTDEQRAVFERTPEQDALFKIGLDNVNLWYAHQLVQVWLLRSVATDSQNPTPYDCRGWTTFEKLLSAWVSFLVFDFYELGTSDPSQLQPLLEDEAPSLYAVFSEQLRGCRTGTSLQSSPPLPPSAFNDVIVAKKFTSGKTDEKHVIDLYAKTFSEVLSAATALSYSGKSWDDDKLVALANVLPECVSLEDLDLSDNPASDAGVLACVERCRPLQRLGLGNTRITDAAMAAVAKTSTGLQHIVAHGTQVSDASIRLVAESCPHLEVAILNQTQLSDASISHLAKGCPSLTHLELAETQVSDASVFCLAAYCRGLSMLCLSGTRVTDASAGELAECRSLEHLKLNDTQVSDESVINLATHCQSLNFLSLRGTRVTDTSVTFLTQALPGMQLLSLANTQTTDASIASIAQHCKEITLLDLSGTKASDESISLIAQQCPKLNCLSLEDTLATDSSVCLIAKHLSKITSLDLDGTQVTDLSICQLAQDCLDLSRLGLRKTRVTSESIMKVACNLSRLSHLGLTKDQVSDECLRRLRKRTGLKIVEVHMPM
uniref:F-box/LRR-repeat protein 15-like leucin rich repeat domain-containing protein n=1 Tax=Alexandrium catenella TaxID=2925 RepID=A0A7S1RHM4_ALECA|mmetsp:Transcript_58687/g.157165  ORF Transcript_58687/g.157165 Transcript_58687/m.157165 type:complete len:793 (+) Transcript_58687:51-2429(+)